MSGSRSGRIARAAIAIALIGAPIAMASPAQAAPAQVRPAPRPCDLYAAGGTPCGAAHSTTRALYAAYTGPLYQVRRAADNATKNIGLVSGGYAAATPQGA